MTNKTSSAKLSYRTLETLQIEAIPNSNLIAFLYLGILVLIVHGGSLLFGFAREDILLLKHLSEWNILEKVFGYWRPVWLLWLSAQYTLFGLNPFAIHAASLILFTLNSWLAFFLMTSIGIKKHVALAAVSLWILMAGNVDAAVWISECNDLLAMFFLLLASLIWFFFCLNNKPPIIYILLACICWFLSILNKEVGMLWPIGAVIIAALKTGDSKHKLQHRYVYFYFVMSLPFIFMLLYVYLKITAQGSSAGLNLYEYANKDDNVYNFPLILKIIKMTIHYMEGILYSFLPLELFLSWTGLILGTLVSICLVVCLWFRNRGLLHLNSIFLWGAIIWILIFSIHTSFNTSVRTQYIATLGTSLVISILFFSPKTKILFKTTVICLALYLGMHLILGKQVANYFSPSSPDVMSCSVRLINSDVISEEKRGYLKKDLQYMDIDSIADYKDLMFVDKGPWKKAKKKIFQRVIIKRFIDSYIFKTQDQNEQP